ncbi:TOBE domain-containing protein [Bartonella sp. LJL80]
MAVEATLALREQNLGSVGRERIKLLEAVGRDGSISAAARSIGLSYKAAWDALDAMQNLVSQPLLEKSAGGRSGGGTVLTPAGVRLIETFHRLEGGLAAMMNEASADLAEIGLTSTGLFQGFMMRTSARNVLAGAIENIVSDFVSASIDIRVSPDVMIRSEITAKSVTTLGLVTGRQVAALIKAPFVKVSPIDTLSDDSLENQIQGILRSIAVGGTSIELVVDVGSGKTLVATARPGDAMLDNLLVEMPVIASFKAEHIIIATS